MQDEQPENLSAPEPPEAAAPVGEPAVPAADPTTPSPGDGEGQRERSDGEQTTGGQATAAAVTPSLDTKSLLARALEAIQVRKRAKLEKIMKLAMAKRSITNDQVEKLLHVSDATATRYLAELVRQGRLKRTGSKETARYEPPSGSYPGN